MLYITHAFQGQLYRIFLITAIFAYNEPNEDQSSIKIVLVYKTTTIYTAYIIQPLSSFKITIF